MTSRDFCYWLQGWFELNKTIDHREGASKETLDIIQNHLNLVFKHEIDPSYKGDPQELQDIHDGKTEAPYKPSWERPTNTILRC